MRYNNAFFIVSFLSVLLLNIASCNTRNAAVDVVTVYGSVIDQKTGQPIYNVLIQEKNKVGGSTVTGTDGNYEFTLPINGSSEGKYYLVATKDGYLPSEYELNMSKVDKNRRVKVDFLLTVDKASTIFSYYGKVTDTSGKPLSNVTIQYMRYMAYKEIGEPSLLKWAYTNEEGNYSMEFEESEISEDPHYMAMLYVWLDGYDGAVVSYYDPIEKIGESVRNDFVLVPMD